MANKNKEYQRLPGSKKGFLIGKYTLWQGTDHLLQIFGRMGVEGYKRFYFSDIQAIITRKTNLAIGQNVILGCITLLLGWPAVVFEGGWPIFFAASAGVPLIFLFINLIRGPTCETRLMTAVQTEKIHSLHRLKNTLRVMDRLLHCIQNVQGILTVEDLAKDPERPAADKASGDRAKLIDVPQATIKHEKGRMHLILFVLLLFDGVLAVSGFYFTHVVSVLFSAAAGICMGIFGIIALVKQHNSDMSASLRTVTWASLGYLTIAFVAGYAFSFTFALKNPSIAYNQWELFKSMSTLSPWESPLKLGFDIFTICGAVFLGIPGLVMLKRSGNGKKRIVAKSSRRLVAGKPVPG